MQLERRNIGLQEIKLADADSKTGVFSGYGAVFGNEDSYGDVIEKGAFKTTLKEWDARGKLPPMLLQHGGGFGGGADDMVPVGKWTSMKEDSKGLKVEGKLFAMDTERGKYIHEGLKEGVLDGLSIGFMIRELRWGTKPEEPDRTLIDIDLWELSIVTFPANPKARISDVKTLAPDEMRDLEAALRDAGLSRSDAVMAIAGFKKYDARRQRDAGGPRNTLRDAERAAVVADAADEDQAREIAAKAEALCARFTGAGSEAEAKAVIENCSRIAAMLRN
jgi:HK97 family phage prohead protease